MSTTRILIVDDELVVRDSLARWFESEDFEVVTAPTATDALDRIAHDRFDLALVDIKMPGVDGIELQQRLRQADPDLPVIIMTGYASVETAVKALKNGAYDYITKPFDPDELVHLVRNAVSHRAAAKEVVKLKENLSQIFPDTQLIGQSPGMRRVMEMVEMVAGSDATVLVTGESGTGKEIVARAIHSASPRRFSPMVAIHCGALTSRKRAFWL
jgi:DNA-binding NtrC family response regulator